jgi:integrase
VRVRETRPPIPDELRRLDACVQDHKELGSLVYVAATTGARRGELCGLRWSDVDPELATLTIARSISDAGSAMRVKDTKTHQTRRTALDPTTVAVLGDHRRLVEERARVARVELAPSAYVWSQDLDAATPYRPDRVTGAFRSLRDRLGLPHVTFHALRHFAAAASPAGSDTPTPASPWAPTHTSSTPPTGKPPPPSARRSPTFTQARPAARPVVKRTAEHDQASARPWVRLRNAVS